MIRIALSYTDEEIDAFLTISRQRQAVPTRGLVWFFGFGILGALACGALTYGAGMGALGSGLVAMFVFAAYWEGGCFPQKWEKATLKRNHIEDLAIARRDLDGRSLVIGPSRLVVRGAGVSWTAPRSIVRDVTTEGGLVWLRRAPEFGRYPLLVVPERLLDETAMQEVLSLVPAKPWIEAPRHPLPAWLVRPHS